jgi:hypothetical protein
MANAVLVRPETSEYGEYYERYVGLIPETNIVNVLEQQLQSIHALLSGIDEEKSNFRYEPGKWSIKQLLGHVIDSERVFSYRALVFARNDASPLPGFDQDPWISHSNYDRLPMSDIVAEFETVRRATLFLFRHLDASAWDNSGTASNLKMTVRAAAYLIAGHAEHHVRVLKSRYL